MFSGLGGGTGLAALVFAMVRLDRGVLVAGATRAGFCVAEIKGVKAMAVQSQAEKSMPFEFFASFKRIEGNPILALDPPGWAAATHAIVKVEDGRSVVHYVWCKRGRTNRWVILHATAPVDDPTDITQDPRNPVLLPSERGFDDQGVEYPFPFLNPADGKYYMYYRGKGEGTPEQTGLLVSDGDLGKWRRVQPTPVIAAEYPYEADGCTHPSIAIEGDTIHTGSARIESNSIYYVRWIGKRVSVNERPMPSSASTSGNT